MAQNELTLKAEYGKRHWTVYDDGETVWQTISLVAQPGSLPVDKFQGYEITEITPDHITIVCGDIVHLLKPGETVVISRNIDGREWSDGSVYDGNTYTLKIIWQ